jgi:prophage maintenance system killer protein
VTFVSLNDIDCVASESEADVMILGLALGDIVEEKLTRWIRGQLAGRCLMLYWVA